MSNYVVAGYVITLAVICIYAFRTVRRSNALASSLPEKGSDE